MDYICVIRSNLPLQIRIAGALQFRNFIRENTEREEVSSLKIKNALLEEVRCLSKIIRKEANEFAYCNAITMLLYHYCSSINSDSFIKSLISLVYETLKDPLFNVLESEFIMSFITFIVEENEFFLFSHCKSYNQDFADLLVNSLTSGIKKSLQESTKLKAEACTSLRWLKYNHLSKILFLLKRISRILKLSPQSLKEVYDLNKFILLNVHEEIRHDKKLDEFQERLENPYFSLLTKDLDFALTNYEALRINELCLKLNYNLLHNNPYLIVHDFHFQMSFIYLCNQTFDYHINSIILETLEFTFEFYQDLNAEILEIKKKLKSDANSKGRMNCFYNGCYSRSSQQKNFQLEELKKELAYKLAYQEKMLYNIHFLLAQ